MSDERRMFLDYEEAVAMLADGDMIHTFTNPSASVLVGADWDRAEILEILRGHVELAGPQATAMGHGLVVERGPGEWLYIETRGRGE